MLRMDLLNIGDGAPRGVLDVVPWLPATGRQVSVAGVSWGHDGYHRPGRPGLTAYGMAAVLIPGVPRRDGELEIQTARTVFAPWRGRLLGGDWPPFGWIGTRRGAGLAAVETRRMAQDVRRFGYAAWESYGVAIEVRRVDADGEQRTDRSVRATDGEQQLPATRDDSIERPVGDSGWDRN